MNKVSAQSLFFPAACIHAAITAVLTVFAYQFSSEWLMAFVGLGHAHEMLFGFALALIAGYTLGQIEAHWLWILFGLWLFARIGYWVDPAGAIGQWSSPIFAIALAWKIVPRFFAAKKWRNRMISPLLMAICSVPLGWLILREMGWPVSPSQLSQAMILLLVMLMAFIGGRIIAPAVAGEMQKRGITQQARVQPRLEALILLLLPAGAISALIPGASQVAGVLSIIVAIVIAVRLVRWKVWRCGDRADLIGLGIGYSWLAIGTFALGFAIFFALATNVILHFITVGAMGTLSASVMIKSRLHQFKNLPQPTVMIANILGLLCLATVFRVLAGAMFDSSPGLTGPNLLWLSALSWSAAFFALAVFLLSTQKASSQNVSRQKKPAHKQVRKTQPITEPSATVTHAASMIPHAKRGQCHDSI
ncbi:NnrS family protein [Kangiella sp.]|uniref:NnrS family protein n=1 Tax=Kangiella sp. TaxID=1920245 RepID=UPI003A8D03EE